VKIKAPWSVVRIEARDLHRGDIVDGHVVFEVSPTRYSDYVTVRWEPKAGCPHCAAGSLVSQYHKNSLVTLGPRRAGTVGSL